MGVRLSTSTGIYGLLWLLEKLGGGEFSQADERVLASLSTQAGVAYENAQRYQEIQKYAAELERRVEERTAELSDANKELEAFNYSVAHDLRGPLRHIKGFSEILEEDCGAQMGAEAREYLGKINQSASRMSLLIDDLLRLSQVGRQDLCRQVTDLNLLVRETAQEIESDNKGREIEWKISPLPQIDCDPVLIKQVFVNLLANAVKYSRPRPRAIIEIGTIKDKDSTIFFVRDNGVGFDLKYADKLFGVFQRLHRQEEFEGTGAGLAIVQRAIGRHHGRIWAEAAVDQGATFYFTLGSRSSENGPSDQAA
jgi:light-regulated signal transduction histidine kinase (bacteriophytochrome)